MFDPSDPRALHDGVTSLVPARSCNEANVSIPEGTSADPGKPPFGSLLPILDTDTFDRWTTMLPPDKIAAYLESLAQIKESLSEESRLSAASKVNCRELFQSAHKLAGSAGMFGLERVAFISRRLERALEAGATDVTDVASGLCAAITDTLDLIRHRNSHFGKNG